MSRDRDIDRLQDHVWQLQSDVAFLNGLTTGLKEVIYDHIREQRMKNKEAKESEEG